MKIIFRLLTLGQASLKQNRYTRAVTALTEVHNVAKTTLDLPARSLVAGECNTMVLLTGHCDTAEELLAAGLQLRQQGRSVLYVKEALTIADENSFGHGRAEIFAEIHLAGFQLVDLDELAQLLSADHVFIYATASGVAPLS